MQTVMINSKPYNVPTDEDGTIPVSVLRQLSGTPADRPLVRQSSNGANVLLNDGESTRLRPEDHITHCPSAIRGDLP